MVENSELRRIQEILSKNEKFFLSETKNNITFQEQFNICDIDSSFTNELPNIEYISMKFFYVETGDQILSAHLTEDIRQLNKGIYKDRKTPIYSIITIDKNLFKNSSFDENFLFYFSLKVFVNQVSRLSWQDVNKKLTVFILESDVVNFNTDFIKIINYDPDANNQSEAIASNVKNRFEEFNSIYSSIYDEKKLKDYFEYPLTWAGKVDEGFPNIIKKRMIECFFTIICNKILGSNKYLIRGQKTVTIEITDEKIPFKNIQIICELFDFLLDVDKHHDKLSLLRNTLTVYLNSYSDTKNFISESPEIIKSLKYNFELYIQEKVRIFLDQKNKLLQEYISTTKKIEDMTSGLVAQMRTVALSLLGTIFISLLGDIAKSKTYAILNLALISYVLYFVINIVLIGIQMFQKNALLSSLKNYTKELGVIGEQNDNNLSYPSLKVKYLQKSVNIYTFYWCLILFILVLLTLLFLFFYLSLRFNYCPELKEMIKFIIGYY